MNKIYCNKMFPLQVMYFKKDPPSTPAEPDAAELARAQAQTMDPEKRPAVIPLDDQNGDDDDSVKSFVKEGWPAPKTNEVDQQANMTRGFRYVTLKIKVRFEIRTYFCKCVI